MEAAEHAPRLHLALGPTWPRYWLHPVQALMSTAGVVGRDAFGQDGVQSGSRQEDHVIQTLSANRSDDAFDLRVLPGRLRRGPKCSNPQLGQRSTEVQSVGGISIAQQESRDQIEALEGESNLAGEPGVRRVGSEAEMQDHAPIVRKDHEHLKNSEGDGLDHEKVTGRKLARMVPEEGRLPLPAAGPRSAHHIFRNSGIRDCVPKRP